MFKKIIVACALYIALLGQTSVHASFLGRAFEIAYPTTIVGVDTLSTGSNLWLLSNLVRGQNSRRTKVVATLLGLMHTGLMAYKYHGLIHSLSSQGYQQSDCLRQASLASLLLFLSPIATAAAGLSLATKENTPVWVLEFIRSGVLGIFWHLPGVLWYGLLASGLEAAAEKAERNNETRAFLNGDWDRLHPNAIHLQSNADHTVTVTNLQTGNITTGGNSTTKN